MLKKLRYKFILIAMVSLVAVLAVIVTGWSVLNFVGINQRADRILDILLSNGGGFPGMDVPGSGQNPGEFRVWVFRIRCSGFRVFRNLQIPGFGARVFCIGNGRGGTNNPRNQSPGCLAR